MFFILLKRAYHVEEEYSREHRVERHCKEVWELPRASDEELHVLGQHVDNLRLLLVFYLPLAQLTGQLE